MLLVLGVLCSIHCCAAVLLVGDDPWEEFVGCVRCIRILSPTEVQQMGEEGMQLLNSAGLQGINGSTSEYPN
ncbi:hypothetical protein CQW23_35821 [Capsicum baccatum]|uniref:Uncharacterized protein n=1 Tax=Capsicum baccatum TaxID=33114 RepID=A0A2G2UUN4_CAPBA|nr:hypothetical protein CQW23_35821 [Capsicum baccatum]